MSIKKSKDADLEAKRAGFFGLGIVIAASVVLMAFTFSSIELETIAKNDVEKNKIEEEIIEEMIFNEPPPPPPPPAAVIPPPVIEEVEEVEDDVEVEIIETVDESLVDLDAEPEEEAEEIVAQVYDVVAISPEYPGGPGEMAVFIQENFEYPEMAREMGEQGTIWVEFVVYSDGNIKDVKVVKGVSESLDREAKRIVKKMPNWKPGEQAGKKVNVRYTIPIKARLG
jgi:protein TonB